ncbi:peptidoglycan D,D-transpeptidase FtsI family protein [Nocardioides sp. Kera G14]|uniref:peptidoglycan D,D-transpeptidase FtsI family protein n=1 Tax=Nocardioides sp. Kera G14 TaxID=2884264 RepID=UPI001D0FFBFB|nr:penicillin-binding protein 2 [Nocardioides sp. Kera G14]UDY22492.1 penicillin-binding protein 2 [Nocardioides sp. Kera G14]
MATRGTLKGRGAPHVRLRVGFVLIAIVLSFFAARLIQLQGFDPHAYAAAARQADLQEVVLPAERGDILDRNGEPLADSVDGLMVVADPKMTRAQAPQLAKFLANKLDIDYFTALKALRGKNADSRFEYVARRIPATQATEAVQQATDLGFKGLTTRRDPIRDYPGGDLAANIIGFVGTDESLGGMERSFEKTLAGKDGKETYEVAGGSRVPLGESSTVAPVNGQTITTTIDRDAQWYTDKVLAQAASASGAASAVAVAMDTRTGEILALSDYPTFDANNPQGTAKADLGARSLSDVYEPGSVEKVLTLSALIDAGKVTNRTKLTVPNELHRQDRVIHDWFDHPTMHWTLAGVIAQSSNIGTVLASDSFEKGQLRNYLVKFGLGQRTGLGLSGESPGILPSGAGWTDQVEDRVDFGQSVSVNAVQMAAAVNTIANGGVRVSPSLVKGSATNDAGQTVGTDHATTERVVSQEAATQMMQMMERVPDPATGTAPGAQVAGYRVAGKTGTAQEVGKNGTYDGTLDVSFAGFAPADNPRFTVYVVVKDPKSNKGGGTNAGPVFGRIMSFLLRRYGVAPTGTKASHLPVQWGKGALKY